ncbi:ricin-type beta-trefoil lectin domain protein [Streptomyces sp. NPDC016309]|uniref:RICIN domain-containing protein n=1 Tax=Streptomyces sp. NPDC016309 TaxID=3364965 RepID=UPI0036FF0B07
MNKASKIRAAMVLAAVPTILAAVSTPASASDNILWRNAHTGGCLRVWNSSGVDTSAAAMLKCVDVPKGLSIRWDDSQSNLQNPDGAYKITTRNTFFSGRCLASWYADGSGVGKVYIEPCDKPANYYQQWYENWTGDGMQLVNRQTGLCLDGDWQGNVYTNKCNGSDWQIWK